MSTVLACGLATGAATGGSALHVDSDAERPGNGASWQRPLRSLQAALAIAAAPGSDVDRIKVAGGVYRPSDVGDRQASFALVDGVRLLGGYAGQDAPEPNARDIDLYETVLSGDIGIVGDPSDNSYHVVRLFDAGSSTRLEGVTVRDGRADGAGSRGVGGGLLLKNAAPRIIDCTITGNHAGRNGAGMYAAGGKPVLRRSVFLMNDAGRRGGALFCTSATVRDCVFDRNSGRRGGAVFLQGASGTATVLRGSIFQANSGRVSGGALSSGGRGDVLIEDCTFNANDGGRVGGGIGLDRADSTITILRCTFTANEAGVGGGVAGLAGRMVLGSSVFVGNIARAAGDDPEGSGLAGALAVGGVPDDDPGPEVVNCTFVGNVADAHAGGIGVTAPDGDPL
ncbi:MAG: right-handed parallel beta-helix repeat-containing protein, partial [Planctomycetota bacterium]